MTVADWMTSAPTCVVGTAPVSTAASVMIHHRFRHLPVVGEDGRLVGLIDDAAVFGRGEMRGGAWRPYDRRDGDLKVDELVVPDVLAMGPDHAASEALNAMIETGQDAVVVVDGQRRPIGIVTGHDALVHAPTVLPAEWTAADVTTAKVMTVHEDQGIGAALDTMAAHGLRHVVVLSGRTPAAVVSWRAVQELEAEQRRGLPLSRAFLGGALETVRQGATMFEVLEVMVAQKVGCVPVVDEAGHLAGLITRSDILKAASSRMPR